MVDKDVVKERVQDAQASGLSREEAIKEVARDLGVSEGTVRHALAL